MEKEAQLIFKGKTVGLKSQDANLGYPVIEIGELLKQKVFTYDPGFTSTASCKSSITFIDGARGELLHYGYPIEQLATQCSYMEVCYLLLNQQLPNKEQAKNFEKKICNYSQLDNNIWQLLSQMDSSTHPVGNLLTAISACAANNHNKWSVNDAEARLECMLVAIGHMPTLVAACLRAQQGLKPIKPKPELGYVHNFLYMCFGNEVDQVVCHAMDKILILHADHEQNASTSTVRMAGSTGTPGFAAISAGVSALWGPSHGGANESCINMLKKIGSVENADGYIKKAKDKTNPFRLMGFGHRVYKNHDPRAIIMKDICHKIVASTKQQKDYFELAKQLELVARQDQYFIDRNLYPNIDFYSGITLDAMGFASTNFTNIFALGRTVGWASHWLEMFLDSEFKINRPRQWYCGPKRTDLK